jgi:AcrR family transcriptional regulator
MRESKAKQRILEVSEAMIGKVGYSGLNVNHVAEEAGVSIGTLYYHFPEGKVSILMETRQQISDKYEKVLRERLGMDILVGVDSFDAGLDALLDILIEVHRENRVILAAMESEVLGNLAVYDELAGSIDVDTLMEQDAKAFLDVLGALLERFPVTGMRLDNGARVSKVVDLLIHHFVYVEQLFGTQQEFKQTISKIISALLT